MTTHLSFPGSWGATPPVGTPIDWGNPISKGLVGLWLLNEGGGRYVYDSVYRNNGTFDSTMEGDEWTAGPHGGRCLDLIPEASTTGEHVDIGDGSTTPPQLIIGGSGTQPQMSLFAWVKPSATQQTNWGYVFANNNGTTSADYALVFSATNLFNIRYANGSHSHGTSVTADVWRLYGFTAIQEAAGNIGLALYQQGAGLTITSSANTMSASPSGVAIGRNPGRTNRFFRGGIGPIYLWNRPISVHEIKQLQEDPFCMFVRPRWRMGGSASALSGDISGTASLDFGGSGTLSGTGAMSGTATTDFDGSATLAGTGILSGQSDLVFGGSGTLAGDGLIMGTATLIFNVTGTMAGTGSLLGTATLVFDGSATLAGDGSLSGTSGLVFGGNGVMSSTTSVIRTRVTF